MKDDVQDKRTQPTTATPQGALVLLQQLTKRFPPLQQHSHSLTLHQGKLQVNLLTAAPCWKFTLDADDLTKPVPQLVAEIAKLVPKDPNKPAA